METTILETIYPDKLSYPEIPTPTKKQTQPEQPTELLVREIVETIILTLFIFWIVNTIARLLLLYWTGPV